MPLLTDKKNKLLFYLILFILLSTQITKNQNNIKHSNSTVNYIEVIGMSYENNLKVSESLNPLLFQNILLINKNDFNNILKNNNLIESFYVKKFYPNEIKINIKQTNLLAITSKNGKKFYIGSNGKLISTDKVKNFNKKIPFVFSKSNYNEFVKLKKIIDKSKFQFEEIVSFYYFPSNRWDFKTNQGMLIKLPKKNILESLQFAYLIKTNVQFKNNKIIDLRIPKRIIATNE